MSDAGSTLVTSRWGYRSPSAASETPLDVGKRAQSLTSVKSIPIPDATPYAGHVDKRSITWFLTCIQAESVQYQLSPQQTWLYLTSALAEGPRSSGRSHVRARLGEAWLTDYDLMIKEFATWCMTQYQRSDDHGRLEERLASFRQLNGEAPLACLERFEVLVAQATTCGLSLAPSQLERYYRSSLLLEYKRIANSIATDTITHVDLAHKLSNYVTYNGVPQPSRRFSRTQSSSRDDAPATSATSLPSAPSATSSPAKSSRLDDDRRALCLKTNTCMNYVQYGHCKRPTCRYKHEALPSVSDVVT
ncbi:hypothetical protein FOZ62_029354, partial [Perkinsus olseni]